MGDRAGFIANALLMGYLNHAVSMYESRYATREDLDAARGQFAAWQLHQHPHQSGQYR